MGALLSRAWHILSGAALTAIGLAAGPAGAQLFGPKVATILTAGGLFLQAVGIIHADSQHQQ